MSWKVTINGREITNPIAKVGLVAAGHVLVGLSLVIPPLRRWVRWE